MAKHGHRALFLAFVLGMVILGGFSVLAQEGPSTPAADGTAVASPEASPMASPFASPVVAGGLVGDVEAGKVLANQCIGCHSVDGSAMVGPSWKGIYGHEVELEDGRVVIVDEAYLERAIRDPMAEIVKGYPPAMPPYGHLTDQQVADLIAYIKSLE
jgi:cytochrome c1